MDFLKIENKHYKNKKSDFFVKKNGQKNPKQMGAE